MHAAAYNFCRFALLIFVENNFVKEGLITKITKILCHENLELYAYAVYIWIEDTLQAYVLGEHTSMKNEL